MKEIEQLFLQFSGKKPSSIEQLPASGSGRKYFRIHSDEGTLIGTAGTCERENRAFFCLSKHLTSKGINVPKVLAVSADSMYYLQQDIGSDSLFGNLSRERVIAAVSALPKIQFKGAEGFDFSVCFPQSAFDRRNVEFDLNYFKYCFLKTSGIEFDEILLEDDFRKLAELLADEAEGSPWGFMYRDFQSRNVMFHNGEPWFIDFQGGRRGPAEYDLASFIYQAKAGYSNDFRDELIEIYLEESSKYVKLDKVLFRNRLRLFALLRTLQVLGAYGLRGRFEGKVHFLESIPPAIDNLRELLKKPFAELPYLQQLLEALVEKDADQPTSGTASGSAVLTVTVSSFSYKKGVPEDLSGNGGGYVFDCRGLANPGRYEKYRQMDGRDAPVKHFIEKDGGVFPFLENACSLVDAHIENFLERGFTSLQVSFGCTGGQHRSVYCAEAMARHIVSSYGSRVAVRLKHCAR